MPFVAKAGSVARPAPPKRLPRPGLPVPVPEPVPNYGPAMTLLRPRQRRFVEALFEQRPGYGAYSGAARVAGYGNKEGTSTAESIGAIAQRLLSDDKVIAAIAEVAKKRIRADAPAAVRAVADIVNDPTHKDRLRAATTILERIDPVETKHSVAVTHEIVDHTRDAVDMLRRLLEIGATREMLVKEFGFTGLSRYEKLLAIEDAKKVGAVIDGDFAVIDVETEVSRDPNNDDDDELSFEGLEDL